MQRYFVTGKRDDYLILSDGDLHHIKNVMRILPGEKIECVYEGAVFLCEVENLRSLYVKILKKISDQKNSLGRVSIAVGLVKEQKFDLILQKLTELGVDEIIPLKLERSIVKLDEERMLKKQERWKKICKEAAEQSKRSDIPDVSLPIRLSALVNRDYSEKFVCSTLLNKKLDYDDLHSLNKCATMIFVIGPEGGITEREEEFLISNGYSPISFGNQIMRVETAAIYVASIIHFMK